MLVSSMTFAAYLVARGFRFEIPESASGHIHFDFPDATEDDRQAFLRNDPVGALAYSSALDQVRAVISGGLEARRQKRGGR